uniref:Type II toxin-antitoxin system RelE/ParE family toxin n=2 Tax=Candidatus Bipolaricaulota TaxID=67810 RepID=H5SA08_9BACT|nr:hypothetical protein HGMM_F04A11C12 [uncultured Acetothermia bacterium]BAL60166.1 hypothetical conserved protein [Candidatus Acetothermum autotrophicum]
MAWTIRLSPVAEKQLYALPKDHQRIIERAIDQMQEDPFRGNVKSLRGKQWQGRFRKVAGRYRLIFIPFYREQVIEISQIILRTEKTYR